VKAEKMGLKINVDKNNYTEMSATQAKHVSEK
jgi:hypothetical protein